MATTVNTMQTGLPLTSSYATFANFPSTGSKGVLYIDENNADLYLWTGSVYEQQSGAGGGGNDPRIRIFRTTSDVTGSSGVDQSISELSCTLDANKHYYIEVFLRAHTGNAQPASLTHRPTYTGTITALYGSAGAPVTIAGQNILSQPPASATLIGQSITANNSDYAPAFCFINITTAGSSTTYTHAFRAANTTSTTAMSGSFMRVTELS